MRFLHRSLILKIQQNRIELVTRPDLCQLGHFDRNQIYGLEGESGEGGQGRERHPKMGGKIEGHQITRHIRQCERHFWLEAELPMRPNQEASQQ